MDTNSPLDTPRYGPVARTERTPMRVAAFRALLGIVVVTAVGFFGLGVALVVTDMADRTDTWDGLGAAIGAGLMIVSSLAGVLAVVAMRVARTRPLAARVIGIVLGLAAVGIVYPLGIDTAWGWWLLPLPLALLAVSVLPEAAAG